MNCVKFLAVSAAFASLMACTSNIGADQYATSATGKVGQAQICRVLNVRKVAVQSDNGAGGLVGAVAGGVAGSAIGGDDTAHILGAVGGAVVGGIAGDAAQGALSKQTGLEYVVELNNGNIVTLTQGDDVILTPGEKCLLLYGQKSRIIPYGGNF